MANIKQLPYNTSRLLCSGQIITSVFSVVKELVENSLDSGSSSVDVKLENYGLDRIEVRDNGCGIHSSDIPDMVRPHCTSKISSFADLETLQTFGFRGEALGALCAVADVTICSKAAEEDISWTYIFSNKGEVLTSKPSASSQGTTVIAANLFKKIPVRRQIFRSEKTRKEEIKKIESLLCSFACSELGTRFALHHNRNVIWQKSAVNDIRSAMIQVFGSLTVNNMVPICNHDETLEVKLEGFFPKPGTSVSNMSQQNSERTIVVVNRRPVRIKEVDKVLLESYLQSADFSGSRSRYPLCFLSISLPPCKIDVNIEPNKTRVLLHSLEEIKSLISESLGKLHHPALSSSQRTELSAITNNKLRKDIILADSECNENTSLLSSDRSVRESNSVATPRSSVLIGSTCDPRSDPTDKNNEQDLSTVSSHIGSDVQSYSAKQNDDLQNIENLLEISCKNDISTQTCNTEKEFCLLSESTADVQNSINNQQTVSKFPSDLVSRCSSLVNNACYPKYESSNNNVKNNVSEISPRTGNSVQNHLRLKDNVLENVDLPDVFKHAADNQTSDNAEKEHSFLSKRVSDIPKGTGIQQTISKISFGTENLCDNQSLSKSSLSENIHRVLQPFTTESGCSLNNISPVNVSTNLSPDIVNRPALEATLNDRVTKNFQNRCSLPTVHNVLASSHPLLPEMKSSMSNKTAVGSSDVPTSLEIHSVRSCSSPVDQDQSDQILLRNHENAQTFIIPCKSRASSSNINKTLTNKTLHLPSEHANVNQQITSSSERIHEELYQKDTVLLKPAEYESEVSKPVKKIVNSDSNTILAAIQGTEKYLNSILKDGNNELNCVVPAPQKTSNWSMGNLLDPEGKKLEPINILRRSHVKRNVEEDFVSDVKKKKCDTKDKGDQSEVQGKQSSKNTLSAFGLFCREFRLEVALMNPGCTNQDVAKILTEKWNNLSDQSKAIYENKATENGLSKRKVKKKLSTTLSQTLNTLKKPSKKSVSKKMCDQDQELIRKRKVTVVQFSMEDLKARRYQNPTRCQEGINNEQYSLINSLSPGTWICLKGHELLLLNSFRLREMLIYHRLMDTYVFPSEKLSSPVALNESMIGGNGLWGVLFELAQYSDMLGGTFIADKRVTSNGFKIRIEKEGNSATLTEMPSCLPFCGVNDLTEILKLLKQRKESATLRDCRPAKAIHYLQGEAVRIVRQGPGKLRKDEVENLLKQRKGILSESSSVCIHNKPFFHLLYNMSDLQNEEIDLPDWQ